MGDIVSGGGVSHLGDRAGDVGGALWTALRTQSIENAPMVVFATVGVRAHAVHAEELVAALVLAIEPDLRQATILKRIVRDRVNADVSVVESPDAALAAIGSRIPDVLLLSALLSPRDEDELMGHLRGLDGADHIQTHTIPQLATTDADQEQGGRRGLLGVFKRKKETPQPIVSGCDPDLFADEILTFIQRAAEKKAENIAALQSRADQLEYLVQSGVQPPTATTAARTDVHATPSRPTRSQRVFVGLGLGLAVRMAEEHAAGCPSGGESRVPGR